MEKEGTGDSPKPTDQITVMYRGTFTNGKEFDGNIGNGKAPTTLALNRFIQGWIEVLQLVKPGGKILFYVPYQLAYGENGHPSGVIPQKVIWSLKLNYLK